MRKSHRVWLAAIIFAAVGGMAWLVSTYSEPTYKGRTLTSWLHGYIGITIGEDEQAVVDDAIRHIGTNGIPIMLRMLQAKDSDLNFRLARLLRKQHFIKLADPIDTKSRITIAAQGIIALRPEASNSIPALIELYNDPNLSFFARGNISTVFSWFGPSAKQAVPSLLRQLTNTESYVSLSATAALGQIRAEPKLVVPAMIKALHDPVMINYAVDCLGNYGPEAKSAVPELLELLKTNNTQVRSQVRAALIRIDREAAAKAEVQ